MSYDLMVFEVNAAPKNREKFMTWYQAQTKWSEDHSYQDHAVTSDALQNWYQLIGRKRPSFYNSPNC